jgi:hypothetical protein
MSLCQVSEGRHIETLGCMPLEAFLRGMLGGNQLGAFAKSVPTPPQQV